MVEAILHGGLSTQQALRVGHYELAFEISNAPPPALHTKIVTFAPRYILENKLTTPIAYRQATVPSAPRLLQSGERTPFHWPSVRAEQVLQIALTCAARQLSPAEPASTPSSAGGSTKNRPYEGGRQSVAAGSRVEHWGEGIRRGVAGFPGLAAGGAVAMTAARELSGLRLSIFSGAFRIDELGETMLICGDPSESYVDVYEYQRRGVLSIGKDFGEFSQHGLLPTDYHGGWADEKMEVKYPSLLAVEPHEDGSGLRL